jgi:hypothetical protein
MMLSERIQQTIHALELGRGATWLKYFVIGLAVFTLLFAYDLRCYRGFVAPEAMDAAQVARNLAEGRGYSTLYIRPLSAGLVREHNQAQKLATNELSDLALLDHPHPDLANPPVYPTVLAGLFKTLSPKWQVETTKPFWSSENRFQRYRAEFWIAIFNQVLLLICVWLTFRLARKLFDLQVAWLSAIMVLGSDVLLRFSVSGLSTMLLLVLFLGLVYTLVRLDEAAQAPAPNVRRLFAMALLVGVLAGVGALTRYSFGWVMIPVFVYLVLFGGARRRALAIIAVLTFGVIFTPWIVRNCWVSGTPFGTAGYALLETTQPFPGTRLMQTLNPDLNLIPWIRLCASKLAGNLRAIFQDGGLFMAGAWVGVLFFAGLMLGVRNPAARRLRYFVMGCLGVFAFFQALGVSGIAEFSPVFNHDNLLVLLVPFMAMFGVMFFLTLLDQMKTPNVVIRWAVMVLMALIACQPLISSLLPPKPSPVAYPPYYPPEIQKISNWMKPDEMIMSDIPWAVAWYGQRQSILITRNSRSDYFEVDDYYKPVRGLYLTLVTMNARLFSDCLQGGVDSWPNFSLKSVAGNQIPPSFPLKTAPYGLSTGLFLTDRPRWDTD